MNYIKQLSAFKKLHAIGAVSQSAFSVYNAIFDTFNDNFWARDLYIPHNFLAQRARVCLKTLRSALKELQALGLILYATGSGRTPTIYNLITIYKDADPSHEQDHAESKKDAEKSAQIFWTVEWYLALLISIKSFKPLKRTPGFRVDILGYLADYADIARSLDIRLFKTPRFSYVFAEHA